MTIFGCVLTPYLLALQTCRYYTDNFRFQTSVPENCVGLKHCSRLLK